MSYWHHIVSTHYTLHTMALLYFAVTQMRSNVQPLFDIDPLNFIAIITYLKTYYGVFASDYIIEEILDQIIASNVVTVQQRTYNFEVITMKILSFSERFVCKFYCILEIHRISSLFF